jgi:small-conductance mechanosensitive channel
VTNDNITMIVPNSKFIDSPVTNWTYGDPRVRFRIPVGVAYGSNIEKVRAALIAAAKDNPHTLKDPELCVFLERFGESSIELELVVWSSERSYRPRRYRSDLNFAIEKNSVRRELSWRSRNATSISAVACFKCRTSTGSNDRSAYGRIRRGEHAR